MTKFQVGDKVRAFGMDGVVVKCLSDQKYSLVVEFLQGITEDFALDGRLWNWHKEPSLVLVERPKPQTKWIRGYAYGSAVINDCGGSSFNYIIPVTSKLPDEHAILVIDSRPVRALVEAAHKLMISSVGAGAVPFPSPKVNNDFALALNEVEALLKEDAKK